MIGRAPDVLLVTGTAGFVGRHLADAFAARGSTVVAVDPRPMPTRSAGQEVRRCGAGDARLLAEVRSGRYTAVVHQGAITDTLCTDEAALYATNVQEPLALADACATSATVLVYASSNAVYGAIRHRRPVPEDAVDDRAACSGPLNGYGRSKLALDRAMTERHGAGVGAGLRWAALRYTNVFGAGEEPKGRMSSILGQWLRAAAAGRRVDAFADTLLAARDFVPVAHVVDAVEAILADGVPSGVYNLGSGLAVTFADVLGWCAELAVGPLDVRLVPNPVADRYQYWTCADMTRLRTVLPGLRTLALDDIRAAAGELFRGACGGRHHGVATI
jgi:ADP-L-glycero-D-manno-heptose 6-epimerase